MHREGRSAIDGCRPVYNWVGVWITYCLCSAHVVLHCAEFASAIFVWVEISPAFCTIIHHHRSRNQASSTKMLSYNTDNQKTCMIHCVNHVATGSFLSIILLSTTSTIYYLVLAAGQRGNHAPDQYFIGSNRKHTRRMNKILWQ